MKTSSVGWGRGALRNIIYTSYVCSVAARNKEIDSTFPITCPNAILEARPVDGSVKPIFRVIPGYFVVGKGWRRRRGHSVVITERGWCLVENHAFSLSWQMGIGTTLRGRAVTVSRYCWICYLDALSLGYLFRVDFSTSGRRCNRASIPKSQLVPAEFNLYKLTIRRISRIEVINL